MQSPPPPTPPKKNWYYLRILAPQHGSFCIIVYHNEAPRAPSYISKKIPEGELQCIHVDPLITKICIHLLSNMLILTKDDSKKFTTVSVLLGIISMSVMLLTKADDKDCAKK